LTKPAQRQSAHLFSEKFNEHNVAQRTLTEFPTGALSQIKTLFTTEKTSLIK
jgi:hypothetical protein